MLQRSPSASPLGMRASASRQSLSPSGSRKEVTFSPFADAFSSRPSTSSFNAGASPFTLKMMRLAQEGAAAARDDSNSSDAFKRVPVYLVDDNDDDDDDDDYGRAMAYSRASVSASRGVPRSPTYPALIAQYQDAALNQPEGSARRDYLMRSVESMSRRHVRVSAPQRRHHVTAMHIPGGWAAPRDPELHVQQWPPRPSTSSLVSDALRLASSHPASFSAVSRNRARQSPWGATRASSGAMSPELRLR